MGYDVFKDIPGFDKYKEKAEYKYAESLFNEGKHIFVFFGNEPNISYRPNGFKFQWDRYDNFGCFMDVTADGVRGSIFYKKPGLLGAKRGLHEFDYRFGTDWMTTEAYKKFHENFPAATKLGRAVQFVKGLTSQQQLVDMAMLYLRKR